MERKKGEGYRYIQVWVKEDMVNAEKLKHALSGPSAKALLGFINQYYKTLSSKDKRSLNKIIQAKTLKSKDYSNDQKLIRKVILEVLKELPQISCRELSRVLFEQFKLCTFTRKTKEPSLINSGTIARIMKDVKSSKTK